ncbi:MAG: hypothetical protein M3O91_08465 [Chloroflexota bacterium]|nr:hypothetical protein [Chloroflexota bacterium]
MSPKAGEGEEDQQGAAERGQRAGGAERELRAEARTFCICDTRARQYEGVARSKERRRLHG